MSSLEVAKDAYQFYTGPFSEVSIGVQVAYRQPYFVGIPSILAGYHLLKKYFQLLFTSFPALPAILHQFSCSTLGPSPPPV